MTRPPAQPEKAGVKKALGDEIGGADKFEMSLEHKGFGLVEKVEGRPALGAAVAPGDFGLLLFFVLEFLGIKEEAYRPLPKLLVEAEVQTLFGIRQGSDGAEKEVGRFGLDRTVLEIKVVIREADFKLFGLIESIAHRQIPDHGEGELPRNADGIVRIDLILFSAVVAAYEPRPDPIVLLAEDLGLLDTLGTEKLDDAAVILDLQANGVVSEDRREPASLCRPSTPRPAEEQGAE